MPQRPHGRTGGIVRVFEKIVLKKARTMPLDKKIITPEPAKTLGFKKNEKNQKNLLTNS